VRAIVQSGLAVTGVETFKGLYALEGYRRAAEAIWDVADVLFLPTAPTIYRLKELKAEPLALNANLGLYTNFVNLLDLSALAVPAGFRETARASASPWSDPPSPTARCWTWPSAIWRPSPWPTRLRWT
jgi:Asp-tRNA(Asn)/Glu-tRNA(Gln) amidotransferase A subunit family amidase